MKQTLVLNAGSSSLKFAVFRGRKKIAHGLIDRIGPSAAFTIGRTTRQVTARTLSQATGIISQWLRRRDLQPTTVAHRIVHGGGVFSRPTKISPAILKRLRGFLALAPLHLPANLVGLTEARRRWPRAAQWAVFDTAAFADLPEAARLYALPLAVSRRYGIRKYGFHGISHAWALQQAAKKLGRPARSLAAVTIHLGAGDSMAWWRGGRAMDTSMGFTPLEGLTMATRSGDLDPAIPLFLLRHGWKLSAVEDMLQQKSGLFGLTGLKDMRDILAAVGQPISGWPRRRWRPQQRRHARLALAMFIGDIQRYLGGYLGHFAKPGIIVFTGAIGQNRWVQRQILALPVTRRHRVLTVPTDEEQAIVEAVRPMVH